MKIKAEKWIIDKDVSYKILEVHKCCQKLIYNNGYIDINREFDESGNDDDYYTVKIHRDEICNTFGEDFYHKYYETINYCPFCGSPILIDIVSTIDKNKRI